MIVSKLTTENTRADWLPKLCLPLTAEPKRSGTTWAKEAERSAQGQVSGKRVIDGLLLHLEWEA